MATQGCVRTQFPHIDGGDWRRVYASDDRNATFPFHLREIATMRNLSFSMILAAGLALAIRGSVNGRHRQH